MVEASDSKWVKVPERGTRRPPNQYGNYRGNGEGSRVKIHVRRRYSCGLWSSSGVYQVICSATKRGSGSASCTSGLKPDHQRERMNLKLHTDGRELAVVGCELNGTGHVCFLSGSQAASYQVCKRLIGIASWSVADELERELGRIRVRRD
ncbi:hypothetical protein DY000_02053921 [Brassica cretica]|uniref:RNase H type-1 domain-containing protein n=1 Tax=Brassica cretica TaxID=69181 RepID=A0ABQ7AEI2_BRACR|nr:hypothetical protein DY000_02053921 [Brassica cretica]